MGPEDQESRGLGAFRVLRRLPASSREVLLAKDADGKQVVLKVFDAPERNQGLFDDKVADEASAYGRLSHPNIVKVVDIFSADGKFVIALEWVDGSSLAVVRAMLERDAKKVPDECWLYVMHCVFAALAEAHAGKGADGKPAPVLHRGVNPSNVLIAWDGQVKLGNFNVAQSVRVLRDSNPGLTWGSYGYFAPEQVKLQPTTTATDVYSAALMLYELLAGKKALSRGEMTDTDLLKAMAAPSFVPLEQLRRDVSAPVRYAVRAGLEPDPKRRIASAVRIRDVLRAAIDVDGARKKLVEVLASIREHEAATVAPPALDLDEPFATRAPPPMELDEPASVELISLAPDPPSVPPPAPPVPPAAPVPVIEVAR
ncbi:MAG TPA: serine/threonine-protein kinase, partial [Polyangiaceae bacterium]